MKSPEECQNIGDVRSAIDFIDNEIVKLIAERGKYVKKASVFKTSETAVRDADRVAEVIKSKKVLAIKYQTSEDLIERIYSTMINYFIDSELDEWRSVNESS